MTHFAACSLSAAFGDWYNSPAKNAIPNPKETWGQTGRTPVFPGYATAENRSGRESGEGFFGRPPLRGASGRRVRLAQPLNLQVQPSRWVPRSSRSLRRAGHDAARGAGFDIPSVDASLDHS